MEAEDNIQLQATVAIDGVQDLLLKTGFNKLITSTDKKRLILCNCRFPPDGQGQI